MALRVFGTARSGWWSRSKSPTTTSEARRPSTPADVWALGVTLRLNGLIAQPGHAPFAVHVARSFPLDHAAEAQKALDEHYLGKLALQTA